MKNTLGTLPSIARKRISEDSMLRNSSYMMVSTVLTSMMGYVFWLVVAHTSTTEAIGLGAATTSAMQATAILASVGVATAMVEWLPLTVTSEQWRRILTAAVSVVIVTATIGSAVVVLLFGHGLNTIPALSTSIGALTFGIGATFFALGTLADCVAVALRRSGLLLARNMLFTGIRIPLLFLPIVVSGTNNEILTAWTASAAISVAFSVFALRRVRGTHSMRPLFGHFVADVKRMASSLLGQHLVTVAASLTTFALPILVVARLSETDGAYFYATWMVGAVFFMISPCVAMSLFAETAADPESIPVLVRRCIRIIASLLGPLIVLYLVAGGLVLELFGESYSENGRVLLIMLTLSAIPDAVTNIAVAVLRAVGNLQTAVILNVTMLLSCLGLSWVLLPSLGIVAVGISWTVSQSGGALWAAIRWRHIATPRAPRVLE
ncbi:lipopolysaccharide biosynthesis protein [Rhodococcus sp. OK302]|uniref:lipopolysaccharide biosynthesis protein n=1 Tax=Rhodococcus sp. OK302 TaxID=1882769 RepID=UPI000B9F5982|nr:hypothetical protein [Rhodococcus sp. OK302]OYD68852.1 O-antigen/teichoic acid export membrane protein [Rhodococcus sp. OK302]